MSGQTAYELAKELYEFHSMANMYAPSFEDAHNQLKEDVLRVCVLPTAERIAAGFPTHAEAQAMTIEQLQGLSNGRL